MIKKLSKFRTSLYTIFVRLEDSKDAFLLVHGYNGAIDYVAGKVAHFLRKGHRIDRNDAEQGKLPFSVKTFDLLVKRGYLTDKTPFAERERVRQMADLFHRQAKAMKSYLFLVAYDCNFRCPYCFENGISDNGKGWSKKVFTKEAVDRAYAAMLELEQDRSLHSDRITLYGGEPLLAKNKEIVEYMVEQGKALGYQFKAITNGYELEHFTHLLNPESIQMLQITIDGRKEKHDQRRTHYLHGASYEKILVNMRLALDQGVRISVRINTDLNNFEDLAELNKEFRAKGFFEYKNFKVYSALVHGSDEMNCNAVMASSPPLNKQKASPKTAFVVEDKGYYDPDQQYINFEAEQERFSKNEESRVLAFHDEDFTEVDKIYTMNRGKYIQKHLNAVRENPEMEAISCQDFGLRNKINDVLEGKGLMSFRSFFCSAQTGMMIFDPYGDLYTCWELVGMDHYKVGSYKEEIVLDEEELENWYGRNIGKTPACSKCKYAFFCGGGCQAHALTEGRGYDSSYCDGFPKTFQKVVPDAYRKFMEKQQKEMTITKS